MVLKTNRPQLINAATIRALGECSIRRFECNHGQMLSMRNNGGNVELVFLALYDSA